MGATPSRRFQRRTYESSIHSEDDASREHSGGVVWKLGGDCTGAMRATASQWAEGIPKDEAQMKPGDLILMGGHVVMYTGNGKAVGAQTGNTAFQDQVSATSTRRSIWRTRMRLSSALGYPANRSPMLRRRPRCSLRVRSPLQICPRAAGVEQAATTAAGAVRMGVLARPRPPGPPRRPIPVGGTVSATPGSRCCRRRSQEMTRPLWRS